MVRWMGCGQPLLGQVDLGGPEATRGRVEVACVQSLFEADRGVRVGDGLVCSHGLAPGQFGGVGRGGR